MQCKNCGSEIRNNVKYCTQCGSSIVSSNNITKQTIYFGNNNADVSIRNHFIIGAVVFVLVIIILVILFGRDSYVTKSNNFYGMRFNKTIEEFCENYNAALSEIGDFQTGLYELEPSRFSYYTTLSEQNVKQYNATGLNYDIMLFVENDSNYIVYACVGYNASKSANPSKTETFILTKIYPATIMALTNCSYTDYSDIFEKLRNNNFTLFEDNVCYHFANDNSNKNISYLYTTAISKSMYKELYK